MDVIVLKDKILVAYIQNNKYCVEVLDRNGKKIRHGQYRGRFPNLYHASNDVLLMPVSAYSYVKIIWRSYCQRLRIRYPLEIIA